MVSIINFNFIFINFLVVENNVTHSSGCARSEGYYKIDPSDKSRYLHHLRRSKASDDKDKNSVSYKMYYYIFINCVWVLIGSTPYFKWAWQQIESSSCGVTLHFWRRVKRITTIQSIEG